MTTDQLTTERLSSLGRRTTDLATFSILIVRDGVTSTYPLPESGRLLIGRAKHAEIRIDHSSVSREHAALHVGPLMQIEDLKSANGTRVRDTTLTPGATVELRPHDVIDLGRVLLVVQHRGLEQRLRRTCAPAFFELRVEEECERGAQAAPFAVIRFELAGDLALQVGELLLASELSERDLISSPAPGRYEVLLLGATPEAAAAWLSGATALLQDRGLTVRAQLACAPLDGHSPTKLLGRALARSDTKPEPAKHGSFVVHDAAMRRVSRLLERVAGSDISVLLLGETGVGKEMCAELVHGCSQRARGNLVRLNCAALPETLLESELFGYERGAFTGALSDKPGLLEAASGGSVFLDEIGDMPLATQIKLLRVLESKELSRLGSRSPRPLDVRVIAATNQDLHERITEGRFREDLYYRLNGISVIVPPLRERPDDIAPLVEHFVAARIAKGHAVPRVSSASLRWLREQPWPGNVRELRNTIERALVLCDEPVLEPQHLEPSPRPLSGFGAVKGLRAEVQTLERERIEAALRDSAGNQRRAAELLGISRGALLRRLGQLGLARPRKGA